MDRVAWPATVHGAAKSSRQLSTRIQYSYIIKVHGLLRMFKFLPIVLFHSRGPFQDNTYHLVVLSPQTVFQSLVLIVFVASRGIGETFL